MVAQSWEKETAPIPVQKEKDDEEVNPEVGGYLFLLGPYSSLGNSPHTCKGYYLGQGPAGPGSSNCPARHYTSG